MSDPYTSAELSGLLSRPCRGLRTGVESGPKSDDSHGGENLLDFLQLRQVRSTYYEDLRDPLWWPQERPVPMRVARGLLKIPLLTMPGPKTLCGVGAGT